MTLQSSVKTFGVVAAVLLCVGCAASVKDQNTSALLPEIDVVQVKENSDQALKIAQEAKLGMDAINSKLAELDSRIVLLSEEVSSVSIAKIEEQENRLSLLVEAYKDLQADVATLQANPRASTKSASGGSATFSPSSASGILKTTPEYDSYNNALRTFNARNYEQAAALFTETLAKFPAGAYSDNCQFWTAECQYATGDYASAIASFRKVPGYANSSKADDAQLKIGLSFLKMGQYGPAKQELQTLIDRYPASEYVTRARKYLTEMK